MFKVFTKIFGSKYERDVKSYSLNVDATNDFVAQYEQLSHDELRNKTIEFRSRIAEHLQDIDAEISSLRTEAEDGCRWSYQMEHDPV